MDYHTFIGRVCAQESLGDNGHAERASRAVVGALAERLPRPLVRQLCGRLPAEFRPMMTEAPSHPSGDAAAFLARVAAREGRTCDDTHVRRHVDSVLATLCEVLPPAEAAEAAGYLPAGLAAGGRSAIRPVTGPDVVRRVA
jgi:uncharacterized protein (DUF2267 family)